MYYIRNLSTKQELIWTILEYQVTGSRAGRSMVHWRLSKQICVLTGVWEFKEFVQLHPGQQAFVQCPGHGIIVLISEFLEFRA